MLELSVHFAQCGERFVQNSAVRFGSVVQFLLEITPPCSVRHKEAVVKIRILAVSGLRFFLRQSFSDFRGDNSRSLGVKHIRATFQEQQSKDVIFVNRRIETFLTQPIRSRVEMPFKFC